MEHVCKKVINIKYNNKLFTIFLDENNRRIFLQINEKGKYVYPTLKDFVHLNDIYNNVNPFINYVTSYKIKECVLMAAFGTLMAVTLIDSSSSLLKHYTIKAKETEVQATAENYCKKEEIEIKDIEQLDDLFGYKEVSLEKIHLAIDSNDNIPEKYKIKTHKFLNNFNKNFPNVDLRIFYENIKELAIFEVDSNFFAEQNVKNLNGNFNAVLDQILLCETVTDAELYHELSHAAYSYYKETEDKIVYRTVTKGIPLKEAMTNITANCIKAPNSYDKYGEVLEYLSNLVDFNHDIYHQKGIWYLIELLEEKYPSVDIDYIVTSLDVINETEKNGDDYVYLDNSMDLLDELFEICKIELNQATENYYESFAKFSKILDYTSNINSNNPTIIYDYLEKYNKLLEEKHTNVELITKEDIIQKCSPYENIYGIGIKTNAIFPILQNDNTAATQSLDQCYTIDEFENIKQIETYKQYIKFDQEYTNYFKNHMQLTYIENCDIFGTNEYWEKICLEINLIDTNSYKEIPIYWNGELLGNACLNNLVIQLACNPDGTFGYCVTDFKKFNYESSQSLNNFSNIVKIAPYLIDTKNLDSLELSTILNQEYLTELIKEDNKFNNVIIKNNEVYIMPYYIISIESNNQIYNYDLKNIFFYKQVGNIHIGYEALKTDKITYLKDVLSYYDLLSEEQSSYSFTEEELISLYQSYLNDVSLSSSTSKSR